MIVCHEHRFIFVHLKRTSGRAITTALAPHLSPEDIVTPVHRTSDDGRPAVPGRNCAGIGRHASAREIRARVGEQVWNDYFKFAIERNPWDKVLSRYWSYMKKEGHGYRDLVARFTGRDMGFEHWLRLRAWKGRLLGSKHYHLPNEFDLYTDERGELMLDYLGRLENRAEHLAEISERIGVPIETEVRVGTRTRRERERPYTEFFAKRWMRELVERVFERDLALLGYRFGEPPPRTAIERARASAGPHP